ncbi:MAG: diacylglycerol kinase family protein [Candidatus Gastranaerophilaceae bacterium]|jgi:YegS/Rv2252/BmrU family lipid kinase
MKIIAIINPQAGSHETEYLRLKLTQAFGHSKIELYETTEKTTAAELAQKAVLRKPDIIIACGGDGTVSQVMQGIIETDIPLGIIPAGTGNLLALNLGIPPNIDKSIQIIKKGKIIRTDIGIINKRIFASLAGCGFDAHVINKTTREKKKLFGALAYFWEGFKYAFESSRSRFKLVIDENKIIKIKAVAILIVNKANIFGEYLSIVPKSLHNDGKFNIVVLSPLNVWDYVKIVLGLLRNKHYEKSKKIRYFQAEKIEITSYPRLLAQADGDIIGKTPVKAEILKEAIKVFVPEEKYNISAELLEDSFKKLLTGALSSIRNIF